MWFLFRITFAGLIALVRYRWRNQSVDGSESWQNDIYYRRGNRRGDIQWGLGFDRPMVFELLPERRSDRLLKDVGLLFEQQTNDPGFDARVYIRSDQPILGQALSGDQTARAAILALLDIGVTRIYSDGNRLWAESPSPQTAKSELFMQLGMLRSRLLEIPTDALARTPHLFAWRIGAAEALVWGIAAYAVTGLIELIRVGEFSRDAIRLISYAATTSVVVGFACAGIVGALMRKSSWAKKVFWEAGLVLVFAVPIASTSMVIDANSLLDRSPRHSSVYQIVARTAHHYQSMGRRRYATTIEYVVRVQPIKAGDPEVHRWLSVTRETYEDKSATLEVVWGQGAFGLPWIESSRPSLGTSAEIRR